MLKYGHMAYIPTLVQSSYFLNPAIALDKKVARGAKGRHNYAARSRTGRGFADDLGRARVG